MKIRELPHPNIQDSLALHNRRMKSMFCLRLADRDGENSPQKIRLKKNSLISGKKYIKRNLQAVELLLKINLRIEWRLQIMKDTILMILQLAILILAPEAGRILNWLD